MKLAISIVAAALLTSCGPAHTSCGLIPAGNTIKGYTTFFTLEVLEEVEAAVLKGMVGVNDPRLSNPNQLCASFKGWEIWQHPDPQWQSFGRTVVGTADCQQTQVTVAAPADGIWQHSAIAHELVHIGQQCVPTSPQRGHREGEHQNWDADNIEIALESIDAEVSP